MESRWDSGAVEVCIAGEREWSSAILPKLCPPRQVRLRTALIERRHSPNVERLAVPGSPNKKAALAGGLWEKLLRSITSGGGATARRGRERRGRSGWAQEPP